MEEQQEQIEETHLSGNRKSDGDDNASGFLNVIFHGLFCFFECDEYILVRVPFIPNAMGGMSAGGGMEHGAEHERGGKQAHNQSSAASNYGSEHVYRAGNWLGETVLEPGWYELTGVNAGYARFPRGKNLILESGTPAANPSHLYAEIRFPYPKAITSLLQVKAPKSSFSGNGVSQITCETISLLQVFTYSFDVKKNLKLSPHYWTPSAVLGGFLSLHLFAQPDRKMDDDSHVGHAFSCGVEMFNQLELSLTQKLEPASALRPADLPFGTREEEMEDLAPRNIRLSILADLRKRGENLNNAWDHLSRSGKKAIHSASDAERCAGLIGRG